jgi:hypothetical protein
MGWFDFIFSRIATCPNCGDPRARNSLFGGIRCPNRACDHFDLELMHEQSESFGQNPPSADFSAPAGVGSASRKQRFAFGSRSSGTFDPGPNSIEVRYQNFRGEQCAFQGDNRTVRRRGNHLSLLVAPTGTRIALDRDRIQNLAEVEACVRAWPTPREAHVLRYHLRRGTTSQLFEQLRRRFPDWQPS